jgi:hypothetical protein
VFRGAEDTKPINGGTCIVRRNLKMRAANWNGSYGEMFFPDHVMIQGDTTCQ